MTIRTFAPAGAVPIHGTDGLSRDSLACYRMSEAEFMYSLLRQFGSVC
jgi:hypothetical protein